MSDFVISPPHHAFSYNLHNTHPATRLRALSDTHVSIPHHTIMWGVVVSGVATIDAVSGTFHLQQNMTFCIPGEATIDIAGQLFLIEQETPQPQGLLQIVGPVEKNGRLRYIDGCTDTLLIPPIVKGEPCLNHLHFPPGINQTMHTHPSYRLGLVLRGRGTCHLQSQSHPLEAGSCFVINADLKHAFQTKEESMDIIAFHPDSDYGPMHNDHPMINRTLVDGISASKLKEIQT